MFQLLAEMRQQDVSEKKSNEVISLVCHIWEEAQGNLSKVLSIPIESIKLSNVDKAESLLLSIKTLIAGKQESKLADLVDQFYELIPHKSTDNLESLSNVCRKIDLCQLIRDVVSVSEATNWSKKSSHIAKYMSLGCEIKYVKPNEKEYQNIADKFLSSQTADHGLKIENIFEINRAIEDETFTSDIENKQLLFHSSLARNFVGILSRGLLLPKIVVDDFGGTRTDPGMLGSGIYFASSARYIFIIFCHSHCSFLNFKSLSKRMLELGSCFLSELYQIICL